MPSMASQTKVCSMGFARHKAPKVHRKKKGIKCVFYNNEIYLLGGAGNGQYPYIDKFNPSTEILTEKWMDCSNSFSASMPFYGNWSVLIGGNVYVCGGASTGNNRRISAINLYTKTITNLVGGLFTQYGMEQPSGLTKETNIYLFNGCSNSYYEYSYSYDILANTSSQLITTVAKKYCANEQIGNKAYAFGSRYSSITNSIMKYELLEK